MSSSPTPDFHQFIRDFIATYGMTLFDSSQDQPPVFRFYSNFLNKEGPLPASKSAINELPTVKVPEEEDCVICLSEYDEAKELPCKHRFHSDCIMKWLGIHGSCPVCRYEMPVDEKEDVVGWEVTITMMTRNPGRVVEDSVEENGSSIQDSMDDLD